MIFRKWGGGGQGLVGFQHRGVHFGVVDLLLLLFKISTDVYLMWYIHPNISDLPGLLLLVVLAVHSAVSYQLTGTLCVQTCWRNKQVSCQPPSRNRTTSSLKKISTDVMHPNVSNLPGHLLQVLLAVHGVVDHQLSCTWCVVRHIESIKALISTNITTAYHNLVN